MDKTSSNSSSTEGTACLTTVISDVVARVGFFPHIPGTYGMIMGWRELECISQNHNVICATQTHTHTH